MCHSLSLANGERNNLLSFGARQEMRSAVLMTRNLFGRNHCIISPIFCYGTLRYVNKISGNNFLIDFVYITILTQMYYILDTQWFCLSEA